MLITNSFLYLGVKNLPIGYYIVSCYRPWHLSVILVIKVQRIGAHDEATDIEKTKFCQFRHTHTQFKRKTKLKGALTAVFNYLAGGYREDSQIFLRSAKWKDEEQQVQNASRKFMSQY